MPVLKIILTSADGLKVVIRRSRLCRRAV